MSVVITKKFALESTKAQIVLGQKVPNLNENKSLILSFDEMLLCAQYAKKKEMSADDKSVLIKYIFDDQSIIVQRMEEKSKFISNF